MSNFNARLGLSVGTPAINVIDASGNFTGVTGVFTSTVAATILTSTIATGTAPFTVTSTTPVTNLSIGGNAATATTANALNTANSYTMTGLTVNGAITATGNVTAYYSDARLKENIQPIRDALAKVMYLSGVSYHANALAASLGFTDMEEQVGVLAQEVQIVLPEAVARAPFDSPDGKTSLSGEDYLTVRYERIVPLLIEAIKEQQIQIDELKRALNKD